MESISREELERLMFFEQAKEQAAQEVDKNPNDTGALTRWGGALLELAHFRQGPEAFEMIDHVRTENYNRSPLCYRGSLSSQESARRPQKSSRRRLKWTQQSTRLCGAWEMPSRHRCDSQSAKKS